MGQQNTAAEAKGVAIKIEEISIVEERSDAEEVRDVGERSHVKEVRDVEEASVAEADDVSTTDTEEASIVEAEDASTVSMWLEDGEVQVQTARSRTPQFWLLQGHTPRLQTRIISRAATRRNFMEDECIRLANRKEGWSIKAMKNRLLFNWYRFGLKLNKNTEARFRRRNFHEEWYDERANEPACYPEWF
ncbi:hypothetical protein CBER1_09165 [Cercospora berteroae]|uniref:Uncharacterized protein n=1 Tax=Cercospora berteroae TaxID=357750 RepID=A0A2S6BVE3_9PEZI|nr:hypothetical protein CBER1_09165 [Cercospora berteroae]